MKLNVPLIRQEKDSLDCGIAGTLMLLKYYGINKSMAELKKEIKVYNGVGTYMPQLGLYFLKHGFNVELITHNPHLFTLDSRNKSQKELKQYFDSLYLKNKETRFGPVTKYFSEFIANGGTLTVKIPDEKDIKKEIAKKRPVSALITSNFLSEKKAVFNFHFNVITGIDNKYIYVNDPMWNQMGGKQKHKIKEYIYALHSSTHGDLDNGSLLKVAKIKKR